MCGIAGVISQDLTDDNITFYTKRYFQTLKHRGPDDSGFWVDKQTGLLLVHRRLAIHDLSSAGAQPMHSTSGRYCVVFNGEIYNFIELRTELTKLGHTFRSNSDTEILLAAVEQWGLPNAIKKFSGMFAIALWDKELKTLHLCRDRLGEKPLYYGWQSGTFYFASELRAIESVCDTSNLNINQCGLYNYLKFGYIPAPLSIYDNFHKLPQASYLTISLKEIRAKSTGVKPESYWSLLDVANQGLMNQITNFDEAVSRLDNTLRDVIQKQLLADVNVGLFLSGGIDSSAVSAIAQNISSKRVKTFTIGFHEKEYDESGYAENIAQYLGTDHTTLYLSANDALQVIPELPSIYDEPFADSSQIPSYLVSKLARQHVTVCLSGDGGDELFAGYNRYLLTKNIWNKIGKMPASVRLALGAILDSIPIPLRNHIISYMYKNNQGSIENKIQKLIGLLKSDDIMSAYDFLSSYWPNPGILMKESNKNCNINYVMPSHAGFIDNAMYIDQTRYLEGDNLVKTDRASMAVSLETRLPLLSHEVVELAWRIPSHMKAHNNINKWVLRNVLYKYVPAEYIDRPKMGFSVPIAKWLRYDLREWAEDHFTDLKTNVPEYLNSEHIDNTWNQHISGKYDHSHRLWTTLTYLAWIKDRKKRA